MARDTAKLRLASVASPLGATDPATEARRFEDSVVAAQDPARDELEQLRGQTDSLAARLAATQEQLAQVLLDGDQILSELDDLRLRFDEMTVDRDRWRRTATTAREQRDAARAQRDEFRQLVHQTRAQRDRIREHRDALKDERDRSRASYEEMRQRRDQIRDTRDKMRRQRDKLAVKRAVVNDRLQHKTAELTEYTQGELIFTPRLQIDHARCIACDHIATHVAPYPYSLSPRFSRLVVCWCSHCGLGFVPYLEFDLADYYREEFSRVIRQDRNVEPVVFFSDRNPLLHTTGGRKLVERAAYQASVIRRFVPELTTMLDFGAGPGYALAAAGASVKHAIEPDERALKYLDYLGATRVQLADIEAQTYDAVLSSHSLEHVLAPQVANVLARLRQSLRSGGKLVIEVPNGEMLRYRHDPSYGHAPHTIFFSPEAFVRVLERAGFLIEHREACGDEHRLLRQHPVYQPPGDDPFLDSSASSLLVVASVRG